MRLLLGIIALGITIVGPILFVVGLINSNGAMWGWGLVLIGLALVLRWLLRSMNTVERHRLTQQALANYGVVPSLAVQKQLWKSAEHATMGRLMASTSVIENYGILCREWAESLPRN